MKLFPFQEEGRQFLQSQRAAMLADDMGLGKTPQSLRAIQTDRAIVVCPASLKGNWESEIQRWRPDLTPRVDFGRNPLFAWPEAGEVAVINPDILPDQWREYPEGVPITLIGDEVHRFAKTRTTASKRAARYKALAAMVKVNGGNTWNMTGTPLMNRPEELWYVLESVGLGTRIFGSWLRFCKMCGAAWGYRPVWRANPRTGRKMRQMVKSMMWPRKLSTGSKRSIRALLLNSGTYKRRLLRDVFTELPEVTYVNREVRIDSILRGQLEELLAQCNGELDIEFLAKQMKFEFISKIKKNVAITKVPETMSLLDEYEDQGEPVVCFTDHRQPCEMIAKRRGWRAIHGGVPAKLRTHIVKDFQAGKLKGVVGTIGAMAEGHTMTRSRFVVFNDLNWVPAANRQAVGRCMRFGQDRGVIVTSMTARHEIDRLMGRILLAKTDLEEGVIGL